MPYLQKGVHYVIWELNLQNDASKTWWGTQGDYRTTSGKCGPQDQEAHINILEIRAVLLALKTWPPQLRGTTVAWHVDNKTMVAYLGKERGARSSDLCLMTKEVFKILDRWAITQVP